MKYLSILLVACAIAVFTCFALAPFGILIYAILNASLTGLAQGLLIAFILFALIGASVK